MRLFKKILYPILILGAAAGCTDQRDLFVKARPLFIVKNDWNVAKLKPEGATLLFYPRENPIELMVNDPCRHRFALEPGVYNILVLNEVMFSESETNIPRVVHRRTNNFSTIGSYAKASNVSSMFRTSDDEVMVGYNYPEHVATRNIMQREVLNESEYVLKYQNGKNGHPMYGDFETDSIAFTPIRVTRDVRVIAHVKNLRNGFRISGSLRGFAEGALLTSRLPDGQNATYTFDMNGALPDPDAPDRHLITSHTFTTFGPWWNNYPSDHKYILDLYAGWSGTALPFRFDVTEYAPPDVTRSVGQAIRVIQQEEHVFVEQGIYPAIDTIIIEIWFDLPVFQDSFLDVGAVDWGEDIIIPVPISN